jgi:hypothetical protein
MPDQTLKLDPHLEHHFCDVLADACHSKGFTLRDGAELHLSEANPKQKSVLDDIKRKLDPYIDFDAGGLKLYEFNYQGNKGTFSLKPGLDKGGPNVTLQFHMRF